MLENKKVYPLALWTVRETGLPFFCRAAIWIANIVITRKQERSASIAETAFRDARQGLFFWRKGACTLLLKNALPVTNVSRLAHITRVRESEK